jgi:hypothetical protein
MGVKKGEIVDIEEVVSGIEEVANKAGRSCNSEFDSVVVNISDPNLRVFNTTHTAPQSYYSQYPHWQYNYYQPSNPPPLQNPTIYTNASIQPPYHSTIA